MSPKPTRIDTTAGRDALTDNPFAKLAPAGTASGPAPAPPKPASTWRVPKTRQGGWPIRLEKRPGNKVATLIDRVEGDAAALATLLKKLCATGGHGKDGVVELQGDHQTAVRQYLDRS